jgi:hypothetical protein
MNMPGFTAEFATHGGAAIFSTHPGETRRPAGGTVAMAGCPVGYGEKCESVCAEYKTECYCVPPPPPRCPIGEIICPSTGRCSKPQFCRIQPF